MAKTKNTGRAMRLMLAAVFAIAIAAPAPLAFAEEISQPAEAAPVEAGQAEELEAADGGDGNGPAFDGDLAMSLTTNSRSYEEAAAAVALFLQSQSDAISQGISIENGRAVPTAAPSKESSEKSSIASTRDNAPVALLVTLLGAGTILASAAAIRKIRGTD